jgi:hypothetical protein
MKKKTKKNSNPTISEPFRPTDDSWYHKAKTFFQWRNTPLGLPFRQDLVAKMVEWAEHKDSFKVTQFCYSHGIPYKTFLRWTQKYPDIHEVYQGILLHLGNKRELGALKRELCPATAHYTMSHYCPIWKEQQERKARLKQPETQESGIQVVELLPVERVDVDFKKNSNDS